MERYDAEIRAMCKENEIGFVDILGAFTKTDYLNLLEDGLHPNSAGHKKIFEDCKGISERERNRNSVKLVCYRCPNCIRLSPLLLLPVSRSVCPL